MIVESPQHDILENEDQLEEKAFSGPIFLNSTENARRLWDRVSFYLLEEVQFSNIFNWSLICPGRKGDPILVVSKWHNSLWRAVSLAFHPHTERTKGWRLKISRNYKIWFSEAVGMREMAERYYPFLHTLSWTYFPMYNATTGGDKNCFGSA